MNTFPPYMNKHNLEFMPHVCIPGGDDKYLNIAAAFNPSKRIP